MTRLAAKLSVDGKVEVIPFEGDTLKLLQDAVHGYIESVTLSDNLVMWVNEDGKMQKMPFNQAATSIFIKHRGGADFIVGPVIFTGGADDEGNTLGLDEVSLQSVKTFAAMSTVS
jgi:hypothetical protein